MDLLERLVNEADPSVVGDETSVYGENVYRAKLIVEFAGKQVSKSLPDLFVTQVVGLIETPFLERVVNDKTASTPVDLGTLATELFYVTSALNVEPDLAFYNEAEINDLVNPNPVMDFELSEAILAATIGRAMLYDMPGSNSLMRFLPTAPQTDLHEPYEWVDMFVIATIIHLAWSFFPNASEKDRIFILQHYVYRGILMGVPVRAWLLQSFNSALSGNLSTQYTQALLSSVEIVPTDTSLNGMKKLGQVTHDFISAAVRETIPTLAQEKFLATWYDSSAEGELYRAWLRDTLTIVYKLQTNTIHRA